MESLLRTRAVAIMAAAVVLGAGLSGGKVSAADPPAANTAPPAVTGTLQNQDVEVIRDVVYGKGGTRDLHMHILRPRTQPADPMPVIVYVHGGSWEAGSPDEGLVILNPMAQRGYFCATIEYRFSQEAKFPAQIEDCKCAIRYLRANATKYHLDPNRIGVAGASPGGHLVALLGTTGDVKTLDGTGGSPDQSSKVQAVCDLFGPVDFVKMLPDGLPAELEPETPLSKLLGGPVLEDIARAGRASPLTYLTANDPPFLILHGDRDPLVPFAQSQMLYDALKKAGVDATLIKVKDAGHGDGGFRKPEILVTVANWFDQHLKAKPATAPAVQ